MSRSSIIMTDENLLPNPHPGEILALEFMQPLGLSQNALARALHVPPRRINEVVQGKRAVSADTDLRLARYFGLSEGFFLGLQADYDLMRRKREIAAELETIGPRAARAGAGRGRSCRELVRGRFRAPETLSLPRSPAFAADIPAM